MGPIRFVTLKSYLTLGDVIVAGSWYLFPLSRGVGRSLDVVWCEFSAAEKNGAGIVAISRRMGLFTLWQFC